MISAWRSGPGHRRLPPQRAFDFDRLIETIDHHKGSVGCVARSGAHLDEIKGFARQLDVLVLGDVTDFGADCLRHVARPLFFGIDRYDPQRARPTLSAVSLGFKKLQRRPASKGWINATDLISALAMGTHWDITAIDQIKPTATTTAIPIPMRICSPCVRIELSDIGLAYFSAPQCEAMHSDRNIPSGSEPRPCSPRRRQRAKGVTVTASAPQGHGFSSMKPTSARYRAEMGKPAVG